PCTNNPCQNGGTCTVAGNTYKCACLENFSGDKCEIESDPCADNPCKNGGTCKANGKSYKCSCPENFSGDNCEIDPCTDNPCKNGGTCKVKGNSYKCDCPDNFLGDNCEKDPCTDDPCMNGGTCNVEGNSYKCACPDNFSGVNCETDNGDTDVCDRNPCENGGTCELESEKEYKCNCMIGFNGKNCHIIEWCETNKIICGNIPCQYDENTGSGFCFCEGGLYFDVKTKTCKELDKCLFQRIEGNCSGDHETCDKMGNCICEENYAYNDDLTACEPDFCWKKSSKPRCGSNMDCTEGDKSFACSCKEGYRQIGEKCVKIDKCAPGITNCQQVCKDGNCSCFSLFIENDDGYSCDPTTSDSECSLECGKGSCVKEGKNEKCICPQISHVYKNKTCIDKCEAKVLRNGECPEEVGCLSDEEHGYTCNCTGKYDFAEDGVHCKAKRMCSEGDGNEDCSLKGGLCEDDFASTKGYKCKCKFGYKENRKTHVCEHMCETADCEKKQALCIINADNKAECICPPLLVNDSNGICSQLAKYSYLGDFSVPRNKYEVVTAEDSGRIKRDTLADIDYAKLLKDFEDSMNNIFDGYEGTSLLNCTDEGDDWKCFLEMKLNKDPQGKIKIVSTPSVCLPLSDDSHCLIPPDFITRKRTANDAEVFHKTDPCDKGVTGKLCGDETECKVSAPSGFKCECKKGYLRRTSFVPAPNVLVDICEDVDECLNPAICPNTTTCSNRPGDYTCICKYGHRLEEGKSVKTDGCRAVCNPNPCVHGTCSVTGKDGFSCNCEGIYSGRFCNQTNNDITGTKKTGNKTSAIVGGILGAFLVVAIIVCIILFRRLQKQKSIDDTEEYVRQRKRGLASEMRKHDRRQQGNYDDVELRENERRPDRQTENQKPHLGRSTDDGDYRNGYSGVDKVFPKSHSSRHSAEEASRPSQRDDDKQELSRKPLSKSSDHRDIEMTGVSGMQYSNRGYEED
ncbi:Delta-like protein C, partial [Araneus ventricosus]